MRNFTLMQSKLFVFLGIVASVPLLLAYSLLLAWVSGGIPEFTWIEGYRPLAIADFWVVIPVYLLLVSVFSSSGIILNLALARVYSKPRNSNALECVALMAGFVTFIGVIWGWIAWSSLNAVTFAVFIANVLLLLLAVSWLAGIFWVAL